jgi:hypothetical protein
MSVEVTPISETTVQVTGIVNTAGEAEAYRIRTLWNGQREVFVERKNGGFAILNPNVHSARISRVLSAAA